MMSKTKYLDCIISFLIAITPFMGYYAAPVLFREFSTFNEMVLTLLLFARLLMSYNRFKISNSNFAGVIFLVWIIMVTVISSLMPYSKAYSFHGLIGLVTCTLIILMASNIKEVLSNFVKIYTAIALVAIAVYIVQFLMFYGFGRAISFRLPIKLLDAYKKAFDYSSFNVYSAQFSSFFSEKAHFCQFVLPLLAIKINKIDGKKGIVYPILLTLVLFSTASGNGILVSAMLWGVFFLRNGRSQKKTFKIVGLMICFVVIVLFAHIILSNMSPQYLYTIRNLTSGGKAGYRIYRGAEAFSQLPVINMLLGIGYRQYASFSQMFGISTNYDIAGVNPEYFSSLFQLTIYFGLVGLLFAVMICTKLYLYSSKSSKMILMAYIALGISSSIFLDSMCVLYFAGIFALNYGGSAVETKGTEKNTNIKRNPGN